MTESGPLATKRCSNCGGEYLLAFFRHSGGGGRVDHSSDKRQLHRDRCIGCESTIERSEMLDRQLRRKATEARRRHGKRLQELGVIRKRDDLETVFGWSLDKMVDDIKRTIGEGCPYCTLPVVSEDDFGRVTLEILNPDHSPYYATNVRWCCSSCNAEKHRLSTDDWGARQTMWRRWRLNEARRESDPLAFAFLASNRHEEKTLPLW